MKRIRIEEIDDIMFTLMAVKNQKGKHVGVQRLIIMLLGKLLFLSLASFKSLNG